MRSRVLRVSTLATIFPALLSMAQTPLTAADSYDGVWAISISADAGICDQNLTLPIQVSGGKISYPGLFVSATGSVSGRGAVDVHILAANDRVDGTGKVAGTTGSGRWSSPTLKCAGSWSASRTA